MSLVTSKTVKLGDFTGLTLEVEKTQTNRGRNVEWAAFIWFDESHLVASGHGSTRRRAIFTAQKKFKASLKENFEFIQGS